VAQRLHEALVKVLAQPDVVKQLEATGGVASPSSSGAEMKTFVQAQVSRWSKVVKDANIPMQ
jgi:tripartite-type tricarboxylate transporter receptor subunit TctC